MADTTGGMYKKGIMRLQKGYERYERVIRVFGAISVAICMDMWAIYEYFGQYLGRFGGICGRYVPTNEKIGDMCSG